MCVGVYNKARQMQTTVHESEAEKPKNLVALSAKEKKLIDLIRSIECAHIEIYVQDCIPLRVVEIREGHKL